MVMEYLLKTQAFWHLGLSFFGMIAGYYILFKLKTQLRFILSFFIVFFTGLIYEIIQGKAYDTGSDLVANFVGLVLAVLLLIIIEKNG